MNASYAHPISNDFGRGWVALDRRFCMDVNSKGYRVDAA